MNLSTIKKFVAWSRQAAAGLVPRRIREAAARSRARRERRQLEQSTGRRVQLTSFASADLGRLGLSASDAFHSINTTFASTALDDSCELALLECRDYAVLYGADHLTLRLWRVFRYAERTSELECALEAFRSAAKLPYREKGANGLLFRHDRARVVATLRSLHESIVAFGLQCDVEPARFAQNEHFIDAVEEAHIPSGSGLFIKPLIVFAEAYIAAAHRSIVELIAA